MLGDRRWLEAGEIDVERDVFVRMAVDDEERQRLAVGVLDGGDVEIGHVVGDLGIVGRPIDGDVQRVTAAIERGVLVGVVGRLLPSRAAVLGHDRRDDVHELRDAGDLHAIGVGG